LFKVSAFLSGVDVLLEALDGRNPSGFSDEGCDMAGYGLHLWKNLNT